MFLKVFCELGVTLKKKTDKLRTFSEKGGGGPAMSEVLYKISDDNKFVYFTCSHDKEVNIGEQNHQNQKLSAGANMDFKPDFYFFHF